MGVGWYVHKRGVGGGKESIIEREGGEEKG